jgi:hypothetical protein
MTGYAKLLNLHTLIALQTVLLLLQVQETVDRFELNAEQGDVLTRCARYKHNVSDNSSFCLL